MHTLEFPQNRERKAHNKEKPEQEDGKCSDVRKIKRSFQKIGILKKPLVRLGCKEIVYSIFKEQVFVRPYVKKIIASGVLAFA